MGYHKIKVLFVRLCLRVKLFPSIRTKVNLCFDAVLGCFTNFVMVYVIYSGRDFNTRMKVAFTMLFFEETQYTHFSVNVKTVDEQSTTGAPTPGECMKL